MLQNQEKHITYMTVYICICMHEKNIGQQYVLNEIVPASNIVKGVSFNFSSI